MSNRRRSSHGPRVHQRTIVHAQVDPMATFAKHVAPKPNGCWAYNDNLATYGRFQSINAHHWVWEALHGPIEDGDHIHHTCENPGCVNPKHLERLTASEHAREHHRLRAA